MEYEFAEIVHQLSTWLTAATADAGHSNGKNGRGRNLHPRTAELRRLMQDACPELATSNFTTMDQLLRTHGGEPAAWKLDGKD